MKTRFLKTLSLVVLALWAGFNVYKVQTTVKLSDTQMKNVEALATSEGPPFEIWHGAELKVYSSTCKICKEEPGYICNIHDQLPDCYGKN